MNKFINISVFKNLIKQMEKEKKEKFFRLIKTDLYNYTTAPILKDVLKWILDDKCISEYTSNAESINIKTFGVVGIFSQISEIAKSLLIYYNGLEKYKIL